MSKPDTLMIDDVKYVRADSAQNVDIGEIKIIVLLSGFVYVGHVQAVDAQGMVKVSKSSNIRYWGTTQGLGELVNGPLAKTKLDKVGTIIIPLSSVNHFIEVSQSKWS